MLDQIFFIFLFFLSWDIGSYQQHVARKAPVSKKWETNTEITTKTACEALWSYLHSKKDSKTLQRLGPYITSSEKKAKSKRITIYKFIILAMVLLYKEQFSTPMMLSTQYYPKLLQSNMRNSKNNYKYPLLFISTISMSIGINKI